MTEQRHDTDHRLRQLMQLEIRARQAESQAAVLREQVTAYVEQEAITEAEIDVLDEVIAQRNVEQLERLLARSKDSLKRAKVRHDAAKERIRRHEVDST